MLFTNDFGCQWTPRVPGSSSETPPAPERKAVSFGHLGTSTGNKPWFLRWAYSHPQIDGKFDGDLLFHLVGEYYLISYHCFYQQIIGIAVVLVMGWPGVELRHQPGRFKTLTVSQIHKFLVSVFCRNHHTSSSIYLLNYVDTHTYLPIYLSTDLPIYLSTYLPTYLPACLSTCLPTYLPTYLRTYPRTYYLRTYLRTYVHTCIRAYVHTSIGTYVHSHVYIYIEREREIDIIHI